MLRILSIDGGGVRGIIPIMWLTHLEKRAGRRTAELFDLIVGTSVGGMIALALTCPRNGGAPYSAKEVRNLNFASAKSIFPRDHAKRDLSAIPPGGSMYPAQPLQHFLEEVLGDAKLSQAILPVAVTTCDLANTQALGTPPGPSISSASDIVAVNPNGDLLVYRAMLGGALQGPAKIGVGFHGVKSIHAMDWNRDGTMDIVVQWSKGTVDVYHGLAQGGFGGARNIGTAGWETMTVYPDPVVSQSGLPGLLARDTAGKLRRYTNPDGVSYLQGGTVIGEGWNGFKLVSLDWNGDGISDILAVNPSGNMAYY